MHRSLLGLLAVAASVGAVSLVACGDTPTPKTPGPASSNASEVPSGEPSSRTAPSASADTPPQPPTPPLVKIAADKVDAAQRAGGEKFADTYFKTRNVRKFPLLGEETTPKLREFMSVPVQQRSFGIITKLFGTYKSLEFVEAWRVNGETNATVYRFRGTFTKGKPEVRVVYDDSGKVAGFFVKPWWDSIQGPSRTKLDKVEPAHRATAERVGRALFDAWSKGKFVPLTSPELSESVKKELTKETQEKAWTQIKSEVGNFKSMTFVDAWTMFLGEIPPLTLLRFEGSFSKPMADDKLEVRVVIDAEGKVAGFVVKPWKKDDPSKDSASP